jgi:hypothetical protein
MHGPWREWSDAQQMGAVANIGDTALADCGDPAIVELNSALRRMRRAVGTIRRAGLE